MELIYFLPCLPCYECTEDEQKAFVYEDHSGKILIVLTLTTVLSNCDHQVGVTPVTLREGGRAKKREKVHIDLEVNQNGWFERNI